MILHQPIIITGVANQTVFDPGLQSTEKVKKRLISILAQVEKYEGNTVEGWIEKAKIFGIPDYLFDTQERESDEKMNKSANRMNEIPVAVDLAVGEIFQVAMNCGANDTDFYGAYVYEVTG